MKLARIALGRVAEIFDSVVDGVPMEERFPAEFIAGLRQVPPEIEDQVRVGWQLTEAGAIVAPAAPAPEVPASVTKRQARLALLGAGLLDTVEALVAQQPAAVRITWADATEWRRDDAILQQLATALELDGAAIDALFITAATL